MTPRPKSAVKKYPKPQVMRTLSPMRAWASRVRGKGETVALVPTMGALHAGHLALVRLARRRADRVVVSIFVNPAQFAPNEDFSSYPRTWDADVAALSELSVDAIWAPNVATMYPDGFATRIAPGGPALAGLEDKFRPHFFGGVCTVVAKLLLQVTPDFATFGEKDGLAMSSRNAYLSANERAAAPTLSRVLKECAAQLKAGQSLAMTLAEGEAQIERAGFLVDYLEARHAETLAPIAKLVDGPMRLLVAAKLGRTRLIDNIGV